ncbi:HPF/RaiA family ribosome-associated protein [Candidatus Dojkabacteria bacterium]|uniref:HPF/RaiA family ribosome-associated protein n=1 Tax=Candidatus Dojkabacteria bacterium TaxID=2099670 RepID=A0A955LAW2_9BACT|nr:HPF/RaiA family ribosome-associated protein [Candidatus Dojkabacteria bacterium]
MHINITAPSLTKPTYQTLEEYATKRFQKIEKLLRKKAQTDHELRIGVDKSGDMYELKAEIFIPVSIVARVKDRDLRKAVDMAVDQIKRQLKSGHQRRIDLREKGKRVFKKIKGLADGIFDRE